MCADISGVVNTINAHRYRYANEDELQEGILRALLAQGFAPTREVRLAPHERIDLMVEKVGIEVKVDGPLQRVWGQLERYAQSPSVEGLVLVTTKVIHLGVPRELSGKPVHVVRIRGPLA